MDGAEKCCETACVSEVERLRQTIIGIVVVAAILIVSLLLYNDQTARSCTAQGGTLTGSLIKTCEPASDNYGY